MNGPRRTAAGSVPKRGGRRAAPPPPRRWPRMLLTSLGVLMVLLAVGTIVYQTYQANTARRETEYARTLAEWQNCRVDAIVRSSVTDDFIASILDANKRIEQSDSFTAAKVPRRALDQRLEALQAARRLALADQARCGEKPERPDGAPT